MAEFPFGQFAQKNQKIKDMPLAVASPLDILVIRRQRVSYLPIATKSGSQRSRFLNGGPGWSRTNDVSYVTDLQSAAIANYAY